MYLNVKQLVRSLGLLLGTESPVMTPTGLDFLEDLSDAACQKQIRQADTLVHCCARAMLHERRIMQRSTFTHMSKNNRVTWLCTAVHKTRTD